MPRRSTPPARRTAKKAAPKTRTRVIARDSPAAPAKPLKLSGHDASFPTRDPYARRLELPKLPAGLQVGSGMAFDDAGPNGGAFPNQAYLGNTFNLYFPGYPYLAMLTQRSEFRQPVATVAKEMTRRWIEFKANGTGDKAKKIKKIEDAFRRFKIRQLFRRGEVHDGQYGVGHIFVNIKGQDDSESKKLPLLVDRKSITKGSLLGFKNIDPTWCTPTMWNASDATADDYYVPETWNVLGTEVHKSRIQQIISYEVPDIIKPAYNFGGISLQQLIEPYVDRWLKTVAGVNRLINNFSLIYLQTDMSQVLQGEPDTDIRKRMKLARQYGDNMGMFLIDKDKELLGQIQVALSGLSELQAQAQEHMAAPTHLPLVVLTGITPAGLNASSDSELEVFHDWIHSQQEDVFRDALQWVFEIIQLHLFGQIDEDILFDFIPLKQITGEALARIKKTESEMDHQLIEDGVVDRAEVREKVARDPDSGYTNLNIESLPELPEGGEPDDNGEPGAREDEPEEFEEAA
jgi:phage-related protein (TIGR01555 family)